MNKLWDIHIICYTAMIINELQIQPITKINLTSIMLEKSPGLIYIKFSEL